MKVRWTVAASRDRAEIIDYIAVDNPGAALKMDRLFSEAALSLTRFPMLGRAGRQAGTRELIIHEHYRLVYEVTDWVLIMALVHTALQWPPQVD